MMIILNSTNKSIFLIKILDELKPNVASGNNHESLTSNLPDVSNRMTKDFISTSRSSLMNIEKKSNVDVQDPVRQLEDNQNPVNILYEQGKSNVSFF